MSTVCVCVCVCSHVQWVTFPFQGLNILIPVVDQIQYVQSLKETVVDIPSQSAITEGERGHCVWERRGGLREGESVC